MPSTLESHSESDTALFLVAIICPPLAVSSIRGISSSDVTTNVLLTLCGWVPGVLEAWYLISNPPQGRTRSGTLGRRTYDSYGARQPASLSDLENSRLRKHGSEGFSSSTGSRHTRSRYAHGGSTSSRSSKRYA